MSKEQKKPKIEEILSSLDDFKNAVQITQRLIQGDIITIRIDSQYSIRFRIDEQKFEEIEKTKKIKIPDNFRKILNTEISHILVGLLIVDVEDYSSTTIGISIEELRENYTQAQVIKHLKPKIENIKTTLYGKKLQEQHLVKSTTKVQYLENLDWSISYKKHDLKKGEIENIPYCTIKFLFQQPQDSELGIGIGIGRLFAMFRKEPHEAIADFHLADIEQLIDDLSNIKDNLKSMIKE